MATASKQTSSSAGRGYWAILVAGGVLAGLVVLALLSAGSPAAAGAKASAERRALGNVGAVAWSVRTPVGARLVLRPFVTVKLEKRALRLLRARKPRVDARFVARFVTRPRRGRSRTLAVVSRRVRGHRIAASRGLLGRRLRLRRIVLTRRQTRRVKRAARRQRLAIVAGVRWRARYTDAAGKTVVTPKRSAATLLPVSIKRPRARGAKLRGLVLSLRRLMLRVRRARVACVTRDTIISRLRITYGPLASGRRSEAAELLRGWIADIQSKAAAGVLPKPDASRLESGLRGILARVGSGRSKPLRHPPRLPRPPRCGPGGARSAQVTIAAALKVARSAFKRLKDDLASTGPFSAIYGGTPVRRLKRTLWPDSPSLPCAWDTGANQDTCTDASIYDLMSKDTVDSAAGTLNDLSDLMDEFFAAEEIASKDPASAAGTYEAAKSAFDSETHTFQKPGYEKQLLPLFAEYENLYLSLLRHGVINAPKFGLPEETSRRYADTLQNELRGDTVENCSATDPDQGPCPPKAYITFWFQQAVNNATNYDNNEKQYESKNPVWIDNQLKALDFRDMWPLQDPLAYPYGDPNFRQTRMIYSDEWGRTDSTFPPFGMNSKTGALSSPPFPNVDHPLSHLTAWTKKLWWQDKHDCYTWLDAIKLDNAPAEGLITGDKNLTDGDSNCYYPSAVDNPPKPSDYDIATRGPISEVTASFNYKSLLSPQHLVEQVKFSFADGSSPVPGGSFVEYPSASWPDCAGPPGPDEAAKTCSWAFPDEVLAGAKIMDSDIWTSAHSVADAIVFGFRNEDSFAPPSPPTFGKLTAPSNEQKCVAVDQATLEGSYSYVHNGTQTGKRHIINITNPNKPITDPVNWRPPQVQMYDCDYSGWKDTVSDSTAWETTWSFNNQVSYPDKPPELGQLTVFGGSQCAAPDPADTTLPITVQAQDCDETNGTQLWNPPNETRGIVNSASGLCLERSGLSNGNPLRLNTCNGTDEQKWNTPAGWDTPPASDMTPPAASVAAAPSQKTGRTIKLALGATSENMRASVFGKLAIRGSKKTYRLKGISNRLIARGQQATLKLRLSKRALRAAKRALRQHRRITAKLTIRVRDGLWNLTTKKRTIRLTR